MTPTNSMTNRGVVEVRRTGQSGERTTVIRRCRGKHIQDFREALGVAVVQTFKARRPPLRLEQVDENAQRVRKIEAADQHFAIGLRDNNAAIGHHRRTALKRSTNQFVDSIQLPVHRHGVGIQLRQFQQALHQCRQLIGLLLDRTREGEPLCPIS